MNCLFTKIRNVILLLALMTLCANKAFALKAGDLLFTSYSSKATAGSDTFTFVLMTSVPSSTVINFTDRGYGGSSFNADNGSSETSISWNTGSNTLPVGTEVLIKGLTAILVSSGASVGTVTAITGTVGLSLTGADQIIAYQGTIGSSPTLIAGIHWNNCSGTTTNAGWDPTTCPTVTGVSGSTMPPGLRSDSSAMWAGVTAGVARIAAKFNCVDVPTSDINVMRAAILNNTNWSSTTTTSGVLDLPPGCTYFGAAAPTINSDPTDKSICTGTATTFSITQTGGTTIKWQVNTGSGFTNITDGGVYSNSSTVTLSISSGVTAAYNGYRYRAYVSNAGGGDTSAAALLTVASAAPTISVPPNDAAICPNGSTILSAAATGNGTITYQWQVSTDGGSNYSNITDGGVYSGSATNSLTITSAPVTMYGYRYRMTATNQCGTTNSNGAILTFSTTWTGTSSINWNVSGNWSCGIPDQNTDAVIPVTANSPTVNIAGAVRNLTINSGATLIIGNNNSLSIYGNVSNAGTFNANGTGVTTSYSSATAQTIPGTIYNNITFNGGGNKNLGGAMTINGTLTLSGNTRMFLGANTVTMDAAATIAGFNSTNYIVTNGTGFLKRGNISTASGTVDFPIGTNSAYTPIQLANTGTADNFSARVIDGVYVNYIGNTPVGAPITNRVVNKTWFVAEDAAGGSDATLTVQWNTTDELGTFNRVSVTLSHYMNSKWQGNVLGPVSGSNPYRISRSGITSFSPFGVGNGGTPLPLKMLSFTGNRKETGVLLNWETAEEKNMEGFNVERSEDGASFKPIGHVVAVNKQDVQQRYQYPDNTVGNGKYFYRLRINGQDGSHEFSNIVTVQQSSTSGRSSFQVSPNPVDGDEIYIQSTGHNEGNLEISITDMTGKRWQRQTATLSGGRLPVNIKALPAGTYMLRLQQGSSVQSIKIVRH